MEKNNKNANKTAAKAFCVLFFVLLVVQFPAWALLRGHVDTENRENRDMAQMPVLGQTDVESFSEEFESWLSDNAPFRNQWMSFNAAVNLKLFNTIDNQMVLKGQDGWLFMKNASDMQPLDDYQGINHYTQEEMAEIANILTELENNLAAIDCRLAVIISPNKETVYNWQMPRNIPVVNEKDRIDVLQDYLEKETDVIFVWPKEELRQAARYQQLYFKTDTHWNEAGGACASALLLQKLGLNAPALEDIQYDFSNRPPLVDLANVSATWNIANDDVWWYASEFIPGIQSEMVYHDEYWHYRRFISNSPNEQKLLMLRDSFGENMQHTLSQGTSECVMVHMNVFTSETIRDEMPDIFVIEIVQRYANRLLDYVPRLIEWTEGLQP